MKVLKGRPPQKRKAPSNYTQKGQNLPPHNFKSGLRSTKFQSKVQKSRF